MAKIEVKVGQIWRDKDPRQAGRQIKVLAIEGEKAQVQHPSGMGAKTRIKLSRFKPGSTGYELERDVPSSAAVVKEDGDMFGESPFKTHC